MYQPFSNFGDRITRPFNTSFVKWYPTICVFICVVSYYRAWFLVSQENFWIIFEIDIPMLIPFMSVRIIQIILPPIPSTALLPDVDRARLP